MAILSRLAVSVFCLSTLGSWVPFASSTHAQPLQFGPLLEELQLTQQQRQQLREIRAEYQPQLREHQRQLARNKNQLIQMMVGTASEATIRNQHQQVAELSDRIAELSFEGMLEVRTVLTPEQRRQFAELMQERRQAARK